MYNLGVVDSKIIKPDMSKTVKVVISDSGNIIQDGEMVLIESEGR